MAILDILKKKKPEKKDEKKSEKKSAVEVRSKKSTVSSIGYKVLKGPHITEKASDLTQQNQYIFKVWPRANKIEVKKAIKEVFGKDAISVRMINIPRKKRRMGKTTGWKQGHKKAIVRLKEGQKIEVLPR